MTLPTPRKQFSLYPASAPVRILQVDPPRCNATATPRRSTPNRFEASVPKLQLSGKDSCPGSLRSVGSSSVIEDAKYETMVNYLSQQQRSKAWITEASGDGEGVMICRNRGGYLTCPAELGTSLLASYCTSLNISNAMTVRSEVVRTFLECLSEVSQALLSNGSSIQILSDMNDLSTAKQDHSAALLRSEYLLLVWDTDPLNLISRASTIENEFMKLIWMTTGAEAVSEHLDKDQTSMASQLHTDEENGQAKADSRPTHIMSGVHVGITLFLILALMGAGFREVAREIKVDGDYKRLALLAFLPIQTFFTLFFAHAFIGCIAQCIGPIRQMTTNSRYYSAIKPRRLTGDLPHVTVQCPVYKETLEAVIAPTVRSVKKAMRTYELQGGSVNLFINDDGLQLLDEDQRRARIDFYTENGIGWTARPPHGSDGFVRRGKFKKASNLNFGLMVSNMIEERLSRVQRDEKWNQEREHQEYQKCIKKVLQEDGKVWAEGDIRIGDYILLIDSDTRVPADCLLDACSEMENAPQIGILQFSSDVMQVVNTYFENGITFFTRLIYTAIRYTVSNGDVAPFVGHNALLRWSSLQAISYQDEDGYDKYWSESHVSEDFDMSLRLQMEGYIIRLSAWAGDGFKEGVSLTVYDELARWEKYAYGCNELLFHPVRLWLVRGPFTKLFRKFLFSRIAVSTKVTVLAYVGTYYAVGAAWILTLANYFAVGWYGGYLDKYYIDSWKVCMTTSARGGLGICLQSRNIFEVWFSLVLLFSGLGNISLAIMQHRINEKPFHRALLENCKWIILLAIFFGGLSLHISYALLAHMFELRMTWGTTSKEAEFSNFFIEVPRVLRRFKFSFVFAAVAVAMMVVLAKASFVPYGWGITEFVAVLPLAVVVGSHSLLPIVLNPALMTFSW